MGLRNGKEYNGQFGRIEKFIAAKGRYAVDVPGKKTIALKPGNIDKTKMQLSDEGFGRHGLKFTSKPEQDGVRLFYEG